MSIEAAIQENTAVLRELIETIRIGREVNRKPTADEEARAIEHNDAEVSAPEITQGKIDAAVLAYAKTHGRPATLELLQKFGASTSKQIKESDRVAFMAACK